MMIHPLLSALAANLRHAPSVALQGATKQTWGSVYAALPRPAAAMPAADRHGAEPVAPPPPPPDKPTVRLPEPSKWPPPKAPPGDVPPEPEPWLPPAKQPPLWPEHPLNLWPLSARTDEPADGICQPSSFASM